MKLKSLRVGRIKREVYRNTFKYNYQKPRTKEVAGKHESKSKRKGGMNYVWHGNRGGLLRGGRDEDMREGSGGYKRTMTTQGT